METASGPARTRGQDRDEARGNSKQRRQARSIHGITTLYDVRDDIQGVSQVADFFADSVRWAV